MANRKAKPSKKGNAITRPKIAGDVPVSYGELLEDLKVRIRAAQVKAVLSVNRELIALYWDIGRSIVERQRAEGWGKAIVERLSDDLGREFPGLEGFSARNIWHMRSFYLAYEPEGRKLKQPVSESGKAELAQAAQEDFYLDLLFYHLRLRCYVVIDLKARPFKPEHAGKMNFYLSAVDDLLRHPDDKPSIAIILCKTRSRVIAEYALRDLAKPVGVARYKTRLVEDLPDNLKGELPSVEQIQTELASPPKPRLRQAGSEKPKAKKPSGKRAGRHSKEAGDGE